MIQKYQQGNKLSYDISTFLVDTQDEIKNIPICRQGSNVYVIQDGTVWMMGSDGIWYPMGGNSNNAPIQSQMIGGNE